MGGASPVYNGKNILGAPLGLSFLQYLEYLLDSVYEKLTKRNLVSYGTNFGPSPPPPLYTHPNTDQLLQIDVNTFLILIVFL